MKLTAKKISEALKKNGYPLFTGKHNLTLVGVRSKDTNSNAFNDALVVFYQPDDKQDFYVFPCTTEPGLYYREHPANVDGTAILVPGHYKGCWQIGAHQGKYKALRQVGEMSVYRDNNQDAKLDNEKAKIDTGIFGINLHRASANYSSLQVDRWSAGCQVMANPDDFDSVMAMADESAKTYGNKFSYTLLDEAEL